MAVTPVTIPLQEIMSLHAELNPEARRKLDAQKRNSAIVSVVISLLVIVLVGLILALMLLPAIVKESTPIVSYISPGVEDTQITQKKITTQRPVPSAPSSSAARVITAATVSPIALEVPDISFDFAAFGSGSSDFGDGWAGDGSGFGGGPGGDGGAFGSIAARPGALEGRLYDFKKDQDGNPVAYDISNPMDFCDRVVRLQRAGFSTSSLRSYFQAPNSLYLRHLVIPLSPASEGPKYFGAEDSIKPSGWIAHYRGKIAAPKDGTYRFSGIGDDYIVVHTNGRMRLAACRPDTQRHIVGRWEPTEPVNRFLGPYQRDAHLVYGDWVRLRAGDPVDFDLVIGERPGGMVGFILHVEERGVKYRTAADGRPILPLFTTSPFSDEDKARIAKDHGDYEIEWEKVPIFGVK